MTVKEMIDLLSKCPLDSRIFLASDGEGNNFSPCSEVTESPNPDGGGEIIILWPED